MKNENNFVEGYNILKEFTHELDANAGDLLVRLETLKNIDTELGYVSEDVLNTDTSDLTAMGMRFRDIDHKIQLLADLMHYTVNDLNETYQQVSLIRDNYFDLIVRTEVKQDE